MALSPSLSIVSPSLHFSKLPLQIPRNSHPTRLRSSPQPPPATEQEDILKFVAESEGKILLPCLRTYENDLARLSLEGAVRFDQALTAAAADGGKAADEHLLDGVPVMVIETVFPGGSHPHATISTRLLLPTQKVKERANKLRRSFSKDVLTGNASNNILAMTFRQVVLLQLQNFKLALFRPGAERDLDDLENPREVPVSFALSSSNEWVISVIAEVLCISALQNTEKHFLDDYLGRASSNFFHLFRKHKRIASRDSSIVLYRLFDNELVENAKNLLEYFHSMKETFKPTETTPRHHWWKLSVESELEKVGGPGFSTWTSEYVPAYRLEIDSSRLGDVQLEGWRKSRGNRWEVLLTHSQMVGLADTLDMYFEDIYSLPDKQLPCGSVANYTDLPGKKRNLSLLKFFSVTAASGILLIAISAIGQSCFPLQSKGGQYVGERQNIQSSQVESLSHQPLETSEDDLFCTLVVKKLKDAFCWSGDISTERGVGAWIGELPDYLEIASKANSSIEANLPSSRLLDKIGEDTKSSVQDIASYQVVFSTEGKVVGFQPTSRVAVNHWASNPLAKELYGGRKLSPGLFEPRLKGPRPHEVVVVELLMSSNSDSPFALARRVL